MRIYVSVYIDSYIHVYTYTRVYPTNTAPYLYLVRFPVLAAQQSSVLWFRDDDLAVWARQLNDLPCPAHGAAGTVASDPVVQGVSRKV